MWTRRAFCACVCACMCVFIVSIRFAQFSKQNMAPDQRTVDGWSVISLSLNSSSCFWDFSSVKWNWTKPLDTCTGQPWCKHECQFLFFCKYRSFFYADSFFKLCSNELCIFSIKIVVECKPQERKKKALRIECWCLSKYSTFGLLYLYRAFLT